MIPEFPEFKPLELADKKEVEKITSQFAPYSDFNFTSMWVWDIKEETMVSILNNNLVIKFNDYLTNEQFYSFLGNDRVSETAEILIELSKKDGLQPKLRLIPEVSIENIDKNKFLILEERDHFDYIYPVESIISYSGAKHKKHRQLVRFFGKMHEFEVKNLNLADEDNQKKLLGLIELWISQKKEKDSDCDDESIDLEDLKNEYLAFKRLLRAPVLILESLVCTAVLVDDKLCGFIINEKVSDKYCISHFGKTDLKYKGLPQFLMQENSKSFLDLGVSYHNDEQDLGLPKLRASKDSYELTFFLKKYTLALKNAFVI